MTIDYMSPTRFKKKNEGKKSLYKNHKKFGYYLEHILLNTIIKNQKQDTIINLKLKRPQ